MNNPVQKAKEALKYFEKRIVNYRHKYFLSSNVPRWVYEMCKECHAELLPNDVIYEFVYDLLLLVSDEDELNDLDTLREKLDAELEFYVSESDMILRWFNECYPLSTYYTDRYRTEFGCRESVMDDLDGGLYLHLCDILDVILKHLSGESENVQTVQEP
ncbi:MAG: hypothetical protein KatS3mg087_0052 [Patescibacteria group bacterium]|nr:MAG: hypothetical protein KatS3mg087_0052 [Patescibacteria group bacterium]